MREPLWPKTPPLLSSEQREAREMFMLHWYQVLPIRYHGLEAFNHGWITSLPFMPGIRTLEIGGGIGGHLNYENKIIQEYYCLEIRPEYCKILQAMLPANRVISGDIQNRQPWDDGCFQRLVAVHTLEHIHNLPRAIDECVRLLSEEGIFDVVLPCEGGLAYSLARKISTERQFRKMTGMDYGPIIACEHVSTLAEVMHELLKRFEIEKRKYYPLSWIPISDFNLVVGYRLRKK